MSALLIRLNCLKNGHDWQWRTTLNAYSRTPRPRRRCTCCDKQQSF